MDEKYGIGTKKFMIAEFKARLKASESFVIMNYKGLDSVAIEKLRKELNKTKSKYFVVKNSIAKRVFDEVGEKDINSLIKGEVGIGFVGDLMGASKSIVDFAKANPALKISGAFIDGKIEGCERIKQLAALPPREVLLGMVLTYMKSPITGFVSVLRNLLTGFVCAINEIKKKKEEGTKK